MWFKRFAFWISNSEHGALKRAMYTRDKEYPQSTLAQDDLAHLKNVTQRLLEAFAGVPIGPAGQVSGVTGQAVEENATTPASEDPYYQRLQGKLDMAMKALDSLNDSPHSHAALLIANIIKAYPNL